MKTKPFNIDEAIAHPERVVDTDNHERVALSVTYAPWMDDKYPVRVQWKNSDAPFSYTAIGEFIAGANYGRRIALRDVTAEKKPLLIPFDLELAKTGKYEVRTRDGRQIREWHHLPTVNSSMRVVYVSDDGVGHFVTVGGLWSSGSETSADLMLVQDTIRIGDVDVPAPLREAPKEGETVWAVYTTPYISAWYAKDWQVKLLETNRIFRTEADCQAFIDAVAKL